MFFFNLVYYIYIVRSACLDSGEKEASDLNNWFEVDTSLSLNSSGPAKFVWVDNQNGNEKDKNYLLEIISGVKEVPNLKVWNTEKLKLVASSIENTINLDERLNLWDLFLPNLEIDSNLQQQDVTTTNPPNLNDLQDALDQDDDIKVDYLKADDPFKAISHNSEFRTINVDVSRTTQFFKAEALKHKINDFDSKFKNTVVKFIEMSAGIKYSHGFDSALAVLTIYFNDSNLAAKYFMRIAKRLKFNEVFERGKDINSFVFQERAHYLLSVFNMPLLVQVKETTCKVLNLEFSKDWFKFFFDKYLLDMFFSLMCRDSVENAMLYLDFIIIYGYNAIFSIAIIRFQKLLEIFIKEDCSDRRWKGIEQILKRVESFDKLEKAKDDISKASTFINSLFSL